MSYLRTGRGLRAPSEKLQEAAETSQPRVITIASIRLEAIEVDIEGLSPLIQRHDLEIDPDDFTTARLLDSTGCDCISAEQIKKALATGATRGKALSRLVVKSDLFVKSCDGSDLIALRYDTMRAHAITTRAGGGYYVRQLPRYENWSATFQLEYRTERVTADRAVNLLHDVGFSFGIGELTPATGGSFGRFAVTAVRATI